jgi:hypothetical protein
MLRVFETVSTELSRRFGISLPGAFVDDVEICLKKKTISSEFPQNPDKVSCQH